MENPIVSAKLQNPIKFTQDDPAIKKKLLPEELRKREFDRKLERDMRAIESIINNKTVPKSALDF